MIASYTRGSLIPCCVLQTSKSVGYTILLNTFLSYFSFAFVMKLKNMLNKDIVIDRKKRLDRKKFFPAKEENN